MHSEFYTVTQEAADKINTARKNGGKIIAVGTTSTRTLESVGTEDGTVKAGSGWTQIFIYPGYQFKVIDSLITNFHLPESTLVMLVSALAGREHVLAAYEEAVKESTGFQFWRCYAYRMTPVYYKCKKVKLEKGRNESPCLF